MEPKIGAFLSGIGSANADVAGPKTPAISHSWIGPLTAGCDIVSLVALSLVSGSVHDMLADDIHHDRASYLGLGCVVAALTVALLKSRNLYSRSSVVGDDVSVAIIKTWFLVFSVLAIAGYLLRISPNFSRATLTLYFAAGGTALIAIRRGARRILTRAMDTGALKARRVILIGDGRDMSLHDIRNTLSRHGFSLVKAFELDLEGGDPDFGLKLSPAAIARIAKAGEVDEILLAMPWANIEAIEAVLAKLRILPVPIRLLPDRAVAHYFTRPTTDIGLAKTVDLQRPPLRSWERAVKSALDFALAGAGLVVFAPLLIVSAIMIKLDSPGPVFFCQTRVGFNGRRFRILKFRTMRTLEDGDVVRQATVNDDRVTRIGRWLRRTSVDELPQLVNVLLGQMSLVGPRPHAVAHDNQFDHSISYYALRHHVKPGITGWAQINGLRGETPTIDLMVKRVEHDLWYIHNWSFRLDSIIILRTIGALMNPKDVY